MRIWFWSFFFYSFLGFLLEVAYARAIGHPKRDRKCFLLLPMCPVYGLGALGVLALPQWVASRWWLLWLLGGAVCAAAEYLMGLFYEKLVGVQFWSYAGKPGNLHGWVCPSFTLAWGGLAVILRYVVHPLMAPLLAGIPLWLGLPALVLLELDTCASLALLNRVRDTECLRWYAHLGLGEPA